jgi:hypothetical protein
VKTLIVEHTAPFQALPELVAELVNMEVQARAHATV